MDRDPENLNLKSLLVKPYHVSIFDNLEPFEYMSLSERTKCTIDVLKRLYLELVNRDVLTLNDIFRFAIDPGGWKMDFNPNEWSGAVFPGYHEVWLSREGHEEMVFVDDRPTLRLLSLSFPDPDLKIWAKRHPEDFDAETIFTANEVVKHFGVKRSTLGSWETKGVPSAAMKPLKSDLNIDNHTTYRYGDLLPFLQYKNAKDARIE